MRGSDYAELRAFATIAEHGSFARAASQLGVSPSALSQTIRGLEERLGIRLLNRTTRKDKGQVRGLTQDLLDLAIKLRTDQPGRATETLIDIMERSHKVQKGALKRSTLSRFPAPPPLLATNALLPVI